LPAFVRALLNEYGVFLNGRDRITLLGREAFGVQRSGFGVPRFVLVLETLLAG
jgi:hypothetical protein